MGFSIPAGISAKLASTRQRVVSLVGDGGFLMSGFECLTASRLGVPLLVVLFRDGAWGLIRDAQQRVYRRTPFTEIPNPNYAQLAESFGWKYVGVDNDEQIECGLRDALAARAPCLLDVNVCYDRSPPYVRGAAKQMFRNLPSRLQAQVGMRFLKRLLLQSVRGQT
jgi:acetolactate synthase-1/2/3 large subunit